MYLHSPFNGPSPDAGNDFDAMMSDTSRQMGKAQLQRHISNSSSRARRGLSRISKPTSTGSSPQPLQRRRATTQTIPRQRTSLYQQCLQVPEATDCSTRPFSWHPSTFSANQQPSSCNSQFSQRASYKSYSAYGLDGNTTPNSQVGVQVYGGLSSPWHYGDGVNSLYEPSQDYQINNPRSMSMINTTNDYFDQTNSLYTSPLEQVSESYPIFSPVPYAPSTWTSSLSTFSNQTAPATPELLPNQEILVAPQNDTLEQASLPKKESKELIGMGLYDGPDRNSWSFDSMLGEPTTLFASQQPESTGKGLKLEETWEPPEEEDDSDDDDSQDEDQCQPNEEDEEIFRLAEGALGLGQADVAYAQQPISIPSKYIPAGIDRLCGTGMWQGEIADYCIR